eukprot:4719866-Pyramimonas_sp.AAC.1
MEGRWAGEGKETVNFRAPFGPQPLIGPHEVHERGWRSRGAQLRTPELQQRGLHAAPRQALLPGERGMHPSSNKCDKQ